MDIVHLQPTILKGVCLEPRVHRRPVFDNQHVRNHFGREYEERVRGRLDAPNRIMQGNG